MAGPINITDGIPSEIYVAIGRGRYDDNLHDLARDVADAVRDELAPRRAAGQRRAVSEPERLERIRQSLPLWQSQAPNDVEFLLDEIDRLTAAPEDRSC